MATTHTEALEQAVKREFGRDAFVMVIQLFDGDHMLRFTTRQFAVRMVGEGTDELETEVTRRLKRAFRRLPGRVEFDRVRFVPGAGVFKTLVTVS